MWLARLTTILVLLGCLLGVATTADRGARRRSLLDSGGPVTGIISFGDSTVDTGNNNFFVNLGKADFPPYGRDFPGGVATGRFCNGKLVADYIGMCLHSTLASFMNSIPKSFIPFSILTLGRNHHLSVSDSLMINFGFVGVALNAADAMGFPYSLPYLDPNAHGEAILTGINFASSGSGWNPDTSNLLVSSIPYFA